MIPGHVETLIVVVVVVYVLFRWGELICLAHAVFYFWTEQWDWASLAFAYFCFLCTAKGVAMALLRVSGDYNGRWR